MSITLVISYLVLSFKSFLILSFTYYGFVFLQVTLLTLFNVISNHSTGVGILRVVRVLTINFLIFTLIYAL